MNAPMQPDAPKWLVKLLAEHEMEMHYGDPEGCACGFADWENHRAHVAAVVWAAITERMQTACAPSRSMARNFLDALGADDDN